MIASASAVVHQPNVIDSYWRYRLYRKSFQESVFLRPVRGNRVVEKQIFRKASDRESGTQRVDFTGQNLGKFGGRRHGGALPESGFMQHGNEGKKMETARPKRIERANEREAVTTVCRNCTGRIRVSDPEAR